MQKYKKVKRLFRFATFAAYNNKGTQITEAFISQKDAHDALSVYASITIGSYVAQTNKVIPYEIHFRVPIEYTKEQYDHMFDGWNLAELINKHSKTLSIRPDDQPVCLDDKEDKEITRSLFAKSGNKHRGKYGGMVDDDNKYVIGAFDNTARYPKWGVVKFAESVNFNKGGSTLKKPKLNKVRAGATTMPVTINDKLSPIRMEQIIKAMLSSGKTYVEIRKHISDSYQNSNKEIKRAISGVVTISGIVG